MKTNFLIMFFFFVIVLSSCKREEDRIKILPLNAVITEYFVIAKEGSYWIFRDSATGIMDTFTLTKFTGNGISIKDCYYEQDGKKIYASAAQYVISTSYRKQRFTFMIEADCTIPNQADVAISFGAALGVLKLTVNKNNSFIGIKERPEYGDSIIARYYSTYDVNGTFYNSVYHFDCTQERPHFYSSYDYWVAPKEGIIKLSANYENWLLIDKRIIL